jgi:recombination protein RecR
MALSLPEPVNQLVSYLSSLQGIGPKMAQRLVLQLLSGEEKRVRGLADALIALVERVGNCEVCGFLKENEGECPICSRGTRDRHIVCVVENPQNVLVIDNTGNYRGLFHVLGGALSPMDGVGPADIRIRELLERLREGGVEEVIIATNPTMEGDATALYLKGVIAPLGIKVTRIARGLPSGGNLDYADQATLGDALEGRREI